ncbi:TetR/AcrR family transcriptional regulator [Pseudohalioglobus sediminis]|uniref:TetR/AcrR family transcriptional regulator n=1 Tax=Pseudohalioglobus sediminis TaxID=2606449 RepID=A0A5B0X4F7_9GAMM|nr:TetR/AcrR family transcriptional regulator [Pseudohalioglobus sediminis]KAA1194214.1 TetR/AcrR family transcriptional regulator [Pseudohalioglobus sediminis]
MAAPRRQVELLEKNRPRQARAKRTFEAILEAAAELLMEVGVERISTNLIAERAGITVPALYRYFPNKYAVINALGADLMDRQNLAFQTWLNKYLPENKPQVLLDHVYEVLQSTYDVTLERTGGIEIVQALRAVAPLQEVRLSSHRAVAEQFAAFLGQLLGRPVDEELHMQARVTIDISYSVVEMALEDSSLPAEQVLRQGATMLEMYWRKSAGLSGL